MSHGSCLGNLATAGRMAGMARFRVGFKSVVEKVRNTLQGETIVADWDLVGDVLGGGRNAAAGGGTDREVDGEDGGKGGREGRMPGWTRIRAPGEER
jgi:hypothetical protein